MPAFATVRLVPLSAGLLCLSVVSLWGQSLPVAEIVTRMEATQAASRSHSVPYSVTRKYVLSDNDPKTPDSQVTAQIAFVPPSQKDFTIGKAEGGDRAEKVVRKVLDHEAELAAHADRGEISRRNYDFAALGEDIVGGHRCYVLQLKPRRAVPDLVDGKVWVDAADYRVRRIAGELSRSPSWWLKDVQVAIDYGEMLGMWLQLDSRATADVRLMGKHVLTSQALDVHAQTEVAKSAAPLHPSRAHRSVANSAVWVAR